MMRSWPIALLIAFACWGAPCSPAWAHPEIEEQIRDLTRRIEANPEDANLVMRRGELHRIHRDWEQAEANYRQALRVDPRLVVVHLCTGRMRIEAGKPAEALGPLRAYLKRRPNDPKAMGLLARALDELGEHLAAAETYSDALEHGPPDPEFYFGRAKALEAAGPEYFDRALAGLDEGIAQLGNAPMLEVIAIDLELRLGRHDAALARVERVASRASRKDSWELRRGEILESAGRLDEARAAYGEVVRLVEKLPASRRNSRATQRVAETAREALARLRPSTAPVTPATGKAE